MIVKVDRMHDLPSYTFGLSPAFSCIIRQTSFAIANRCAQNGTPGSASLMLFSGRGHTRDWSIHRESEENKVRQSNKEAFAQEANRRLFSVDFHDFLEKESALTDVELSREFDISVRDVRTLRRKLHS
ncbi:hypothetical protein [Brevibacillus sp. NL20B1]|jgi:hypothetical protein|uniref:hypothetical protein n=1 Tax=Brevibacillus sp. NL20B1 TaxID=2829799 RepID=UPI001BA9EEBC|nr:hypothetical protein [Brevibacillus sp. NL20B1]